MTSMVEAFYGGRIGFDELLRCFDRAREAKEVLARGGNRLADGSYVQGFSTVIDDEGNGSATIKMER